MKQEFLEAYQKMFSDAYIRLRRATILKQKANHVCEEIDNLDANRSGIFELGQSQSQPKNLTDKIQIEGEEAPGEVNY